MIRSDIEKFFEIVPKTIYSVKFFRFIESLKSELYSEFQLTKKFREQISTSIFAEIENKKIGRSPERFRELEKEYASDWDSYIVMISEVNKFFSEEIKTTTRINLEDVPDKFVETLDEDGVRIFSKFFN